MEFFHTTGQMISDINEDLFVDTDTQNIPSKEHEDLNEKHGTTCTTTYQRHPKIDVVGY